MNNFIPVGWTTLSAVRFWCDGCSKEWPAAKRLLEKRPAPTLWPFHPEAKRKLLTICPRCEQECSEIEK